MFLQSLKQQLLLSNLKFLLAHKLQSLAWVLIQLTEERIKQHFCIASLEDFPKLQQELLKHCQLVAINATSFQCSYVGFKFFSFVL